MSNSLNRPVLTANKEFMYTNTVLKKFDATDDNSTATAVRSAINPDGSTISKITWLYDDCSSSYNKTTISGHSTVYFGIIVPALLDANEGETTDKITVIIEYGGRMNMKINYTSPKIKITEFESESILTVSGTKAVEQANQYFQSEYNSSNSDKKLTSIIPLGK